MYNLHPILEIEDLNLTMKFQFQMKMKMYRQIYCRFMTITVSLKWNRLKLVGHPLFVVTGSY